ncbi:hypothetical protein JCM33374_g3463 [Metschnikowia sp. JCM 33374]|nr:hypothetical protein JCM33374_g3463 [Metschnikowia sp. JCM 33374]
MSQTYQIPALGLGTWQSKEEVVYKAVLTALDVGYRHIDTAFSYGNEVAVGQAIKDSGVARSELFVTTKLAPIDMVCVEKALNKSLKNLGLDYVDLYLMHWPVALNPENTSHPLLPTLANGKRDILFDRSFVSTYVDMQSLVVSGKAKSIGVSNMSIKNLRTLLGSKDVTVKPVVNQVELHPYLPQNELLEYCKRENIILEAYSPLGSTDSPLLKDKTLGELASKYTTTIANILISWAVWRGTVVLPKSSTPSRIASNFEIVKLSDEDGEIIDKVSKTMGTKRFINPDWDPVVVFNDIE